MEQETTVLAVNQNGEMKETALTTTPVCLTEEFNKAIDAGIARLKSDKLQKGISLSPKYMEFEKEGEKSRGIFLGIRVITKNNDPDKVAKGEPQKVTIPCATWVDASKDVWMNGGIAFVNAFSEMQIGQAFEVELTGKKPSGAGKVKLYSVSPLF
ncbi:MAG: hypothetical protein ACRC78_11145 [Planktothrix sp.]